MAPLWMQSVKASIQLSYVHAKYRESHLSPNSAAMGYSFYSQLGESEYAKSHHDLVYALTHLTALSYYLPINLSEHSPPVAPHRLSWLMPCSPPFPVSFCAECSTTSHQLHSAPSGSTGNSQHKYRRSLCRRRRRR